MSEWNGKWRSMRRDPPKKDGMIFYAISKGRGKYSVGVAYLNVSGRYSDSEHFRPIDGAAEYWMPMPPPPSSRNIQELQRENVSR